MKVTIDDIIKVIGRKYGLIVPNNEKLKKSHLDDLPIEFWNEIHEVVVPLIENDQSKTEISENEICNKFPQEYLDELSPVLDDGSKLLSMTQLRNRIKEKIFKVESHNSNDIVDKNREILMSSYVHEEYPVLSGLEHSWKILEKDYEIINRYEHPADNPLSSFDYYLELGFYPPPEILMVFGEAIREYLNKCGEISLDEAFFGESYKKTKSFSYKKHKKFKYLYFDLHVRLKKDLEKNKHLSLEALMLEAIEDTNPLTMKLLGFEPDIDVDTFLRGYRRWKQDIREGKYE